MNASAMRPASRRASGLVSVREPGTATLSNTRGISSEWTRRACSQIKGASPRRFDITVPYAVLIEPNGKVSRIVVSQTNCTGVETLAGETVLARSDAGDFLPTGEAKARWYVSALNFTLR
jgi:hypothetical protein